MEFAVQSAYAHGTSALRTHLINMTAKQLEMTWPTFDRLRARWVGRVPLYYTLLSAEVALLSFLIPMRIGSQIE